MKATYLSQRKTGQHEASGKPMSQTLKVICSAVSEPETRGASFIVCVHLWSNFMDCRNVVSHPTSDRG